MNDVEMEESNEGDEKGERETGGDPVWKKK